MFFPHICFFYYRLKQLTLFWKMKKWGSSVDYTLIFIRFNIKRNFTHLVFRLKLYKIHLQKMKIVWDVSWLNIVWPTLMLFWSFCVAILTSFWLIQLWTKHMHHYTPARIFDGERIRKKAKTVKMVAKVLATIFYACSFFVHHAQVSHLALSSACFW